MPQERDPPAWLKMNQGAIGPPIAHTAAWIGMFSSAALTYFLHLPKTWGVVVIAAGFCIPFAIARELAAKRRGQ